MSEAVKLMHLFFLFPFFDTAVSKAVEVMHIFLFVFFFLFSLVDTAVSEAVEVMHLARYPASIYGGCIYLWRRRMFVLPSV